MTFASKPVSVEIRADGYEPATVTLDGTESAKQVDLVSLKKAAPGGKVGPTQKSLPVKPPPAGPPPKTGPAPKQGGSGEVVDPWG